MTYTTKKRQFRKQEVEISLILCPNPHSTQANLKREDHRTDATKHKSQKQDAEYTQKQSYGNKNTQTKHTPE